MKLQTFRFPVGSGLLLLAFSGCGGGSEAPIPPVLVDPPSIQSVSLTPSVGGTLSLGSTGATIPSVSGGGRLTVTASITDETGIDEAQPPVLTLYNSTDTATTLSILPARPLTKVAGSPGQWTTGFSFPAGRIGGIKTVVLSAVNLKGVRTTVPVGLVYFANP